ncbi:DUF2147 domain-containing protein [Paenimyroides tangerinum]|uniref:DUF2147 domain-containing protein n=1 Tax=Paenimyroides tangerinum TaxID=2488728 RepID=A0A3P3WD54_9FLAO|nr:DUF2147 domain-containing protein [Paenimyroides tangerinum]RRJ91986.1 DUF2147 domain-containing protein [Paenimyroides tangerinum]
MKKRLIFMFMTMFLGIGSMSAQSVIGKWKTIDDETGKPKSIVEISEKDGKIYGKVIEILTENKTAICSKCEGTNKNKPIKGLTIITGLKKDGSEYNGGKILDPTSGKEYKCMMKLNGKDKLDVRGYVGIQALGRTQTWIRM